MAGDSHTLGIWQAETKSPDLSWALLYHPISSFLGFSGIAHIPASAHGGVGSFCWLKEAVSVPG